MKLSDSRALLARMKPKRKNKFNAIANVVDGERFDSMGERRRWQELKLLERAKLICNLERQKSYPLEVNGRLVTIYRADYVYFDVASNTHVTEDFKGVLTPEFKLKAKLFRALYGHDITITKGRR